MCAAVKIHRRKGSSFYTSGRSVSNRFNSGPACVEFLNVQVLYIQRVILDKASSRLHGVAHEDGENRVGLDRVVYLHLKQRALVRVHRRLPELLRVHLAQTLIALNRQILLGRVKYPLKKLFPRLDALARTVFAQNQGRRKASFQTLVKLHGLLELDVARQFPVHFNFCTARRGYGYFPETVLHIRVEFGLVSGLVQNLLDAANLFTVFILEDRAEGRAFVLEDACAAAESVEEQMQKA